MNPAATPGHVVNACAPIRICDLGGWTDTWFARRGKVFNLGVTPEVEVQLAVRARAAVPHRVTLRAGNFDDRYEFELGALPGHHALLEAAIDEIGLPDDVAVAVDVFSEAPPGSSTGTSAAATVALIGALDALTPGRMTRAEIAAAAHRVEAERLCLQSGIQDQLAAAFGGINFIEMDAYPRASVTQLSVAGDVWWELEQRLVLCSLGRAHTSTAVHEQVIATLDREREPAALEELRRAAELGRDAVLDGDFAALGRAMSHNTELQRGLHAELVGEAADTVIAVAAAHRALGWKVNGAGGAGGSVTVLCDAARRVRRELLDALRDADPAFAIVPVRLSRHGLRVWQVPVSS